jgi:hypothetical protein
MAKKIRPKPEPKEPHAMGLIICHIDELKLQIESTDKNCDKLAKNFAGFLEDLNLRFAGQKRVPRQEFHGKKRQHQKCVYNFRTEVSQIKILFHSWLTPFIKKNGRTPNAVELGELRAKGTKIAFLAKVEITNTQKLSYLEHMGNIYTAVQLLEGLEISISKMEIALDTKDTRAAEFVKKYTCLKWGPSYFHVFHCPGGDEDKKIDGPSPDGQNEYHGYRTKSRNAEPERAEGGRKQLFSYIRDVEGSDITFQRVELRLYRKVARKLRANYGPSVFNVIQRLENILRDCIWFKKINLTELYKKKEGKAAKTLKLTKLSTKGQIYLLQGGRYKYSKKFLEKYIEEFRWPPIYFPSYPIQYTEENGMGRALQD